MVEETIDFLLEKACVNIRYMISRDLLNISVEEPAMQDMQNEILNQKAIQKLFSSQHEDGWFGYELHGQPCTAMDSSIGFLLMYGVEPNNERLQKAKIALLNQEIASKHKNYFAGGDALDEDGRGGNKAVIAGILASLGEDESNPIIADEIKLALHHFKGALSHNSIDDFTIMTTGKTKTRYYKPNALFPGANHMGILAETFSWRTKENIDMVSKSINHCINIMEAVTKYPTFKKSPPYGNSFVGPFNFNWHAFNVKDVSCFTDRYNYSFWMRTLITFGKLGLAGNIPLAKQQYQVLYDLLVSDDLFNALSDNAKAGYKLIMSLEPSWRNDIKKKCDIYFSTLKALYIAGICS